LAKFPVALSPVHGYCAASLYSGAEFMTEVGGIAQDVLRSFVERIERLEEEKKNLADDIKDVYSEAKSSGFDVKILRQIVRMRKMEDHERQEREALIDLYAHALGMIRG